MKTRSLLLAMTLCAACSEPAQVPQPAAKPAPAKTAAPKADPQLDDLLKRADAVIPKDAPDQQPLPPPGPVVIYDGPKPTQQRPPSSGYYARPTTGGTTTYYADPVPANAADKSDLQKMKIQAQQTFGYRIQSAAQMHFSLESLRGQQRAACAGSKNVTVTGNSVYNSNAVRSPTSAAAGAGTYVVDNSASPECRQLTASLASQEASVRRVMDQIDVDANRMGIYPGVIRDIFSKYGVDH